MNLTDARFFAAYRPEWLVLPKANAVRLKSYLSWLNEVRPWIEGPEWAVSFDARNNEEDYAMVREAQIQTIVYEGDLKAFSAKPGFEYLYLCHLNQMMLMPTDHLFRAIIIDDSLKIDQLLSINFYKPIYWKLKNVSDGHQLLRYSDILTGMVIQGGEEEKAGIKSFEEISDLLESFMD